jgi:DNA-binding LacI/PurR family transcriptional regulator
MSKAEKVLDQLEQAMKRGDFGAAGTVFITVRELAEKYSVSLATAHKVMTSLKQAGLLLADSTNPARLSDTAVSRLPENKKLIGLVVTNIASPFFSLLCRYIQEAGEERGCQVMTESSGYDDRREREIVQSFLSLGVDGLLVCPGLSEESVGLYARLQQEKRRMVFLGRNPGALDVNVVAANNSLGGSFVADHFAALGYATCGYIGFGPRLTRDHRLRGFRLRLHELGVELPDENLSDGDGWDIEHGYTATEKLLARKKEMPRALFAFNDLLAIGAMRCLTDNGLSVPGDVAVAGFDDLPESRVTTPALTTIRYPVKSMASFAVHALLNAMQADADKKPDRILLEPELIIRASTDPKAQPAIRTGRARMENYQVF